MHDEHNHPMNPDSFNYLTHRNKRPEHWAAVQSALLICWEAAYGKVSKILGKQGRFTRSDFHNLQRTRNQETLTRTKGRNLLIQYFEKGDFHVRIVQG